MANVVIVTRQCYLLCESINYIAINEVDDERKQEYSSMTARRRKKKKTAKQKAALAAKQYNILIDFIPVNRTGVNFNSPSSNKNSDDSTTVAITVTGRERCGELFNDMVSQIREQIPDQLFLDKLVEKFLTGEANKP
jgi:hypothetical protein